MLTRVFRYGAFAGFFIFILGSMVACSFSPSSKGKEKIAVTILPLKYLVEKITGEDFQILTLVPAGSSPETYEPTPQQMRDLSGSFIMFSTGLIDFEVELNHKLSDSKVPVIQLGDKLELISGTCAHGHDHGGVDPHIWFSPAILLEMSSQIYSSISEIYPDSIKYRDNFLNLTDSIKTTDRIIKDMIALSGKKTFLIYHPALTYYARDYDLVQISLENDGKEPSASYLAEVIKLVKEQRLDKILYQRQFNRSAVEALSVETGIEPIEFDPLDENLLRNIIYVTQKITSTK